MANTLFSSQPGVAKHIKDLEDELGIEAFVRRGKRLLGLTEPGKELLSVVDAFRLQHAIYSVCESLALFRFFAQQRGLVCATDVLAEQVAMP